MKDKQKEILITDNRFISAGARELEAPKYNCEAPITEVWVRSLQRGPGAEPLVRGSDGRKPP